MELNLQGGYGNKGVEGKTRPTPGLSNFLTSQLWARI